MNYSQIKAFLIILIFTLANAEKFSYSSKDFTETAEEINNPDQGFYKAIVVTLEKEDFRVKTEFPKNQLLHLRCDISAFSKAVNHIQDYDLTGYALESLDNYLGEIRNKNKNVVIRFTYDKEVAGNANQEASMAQIRTHIRQLSDILNKYPDTITAIEAGMLGPWGEMHTSVVAEDDSNKAEVFKNWLQHIKVIPIMARTPSAIYAYFGKTLDQMQEFSISPDDPGYRLGIYNDCFLSSEDDRGTYKDRERETKWLSKINEHLPFGGEICRVHQYSDLKFCIPEMKLLKTNYINGGFDHDVTDIKWRQEKYTSAYGQDKIFYGLTAFDYIKRHLGYRLFIKSLSVSYEQYGPFSLKIKLENVGFGHLVKTKKLDIIYTDKDNKEIKRFNVGEYNGSFGNLKIDIDGDFLGAEEASEYKVNLRIYGSFENDMVYYPVQLANENIYDKDLMAHYLFSVKDGLVNGEKQKGKDKDTSNVTTDDRCGVYNGKICPPGYCCSTFGHCGTSDDFCGKYCDPKYSKCNPKSKPEVSTDRRCGKFNGKICPETDCCSIYGYCGLSQDHCNKLCDKDYSTCYEELEVTTDDACGKKNGKRCPQGQCCSTYGYCGTNEDFCIKYCDHRYSICKS